MSHKDGLSSPFDDNIPSLGYAGHLEFHFRECEDVGGGSHGAKEFSNGGLCRGGGEETEGANHEVGEGAVGGAVLGFVEFKVGNLRGSLEG